MLDSTINLVKADIVDAALIENLARTIWHEYYPSIITVEQIDYMLKKMYSQDSLLEQMTQKKDTFYLVLVNHEPQGFISITHNDEKNYFLNKFYLIQNSAAKGKGTRAFKQLLSILQPNKITLTVNRQNFKSINFYFKNGFVIERVADFDIGNNYVMNDFVMIWNKPS
ncbi:MAG: GNAT family N-acetyltransferase [Bacteroidota bacterium]|nr:GNAT family N-acetyltransferase [Bacteroidota bacterium]